MTTTDYEWPWVITSDHKWPRVTTSDHGWPRERFNQNIIVLLLWRHYRAIFTLSHQIILLSHENCYLLYKRLAGDLKYLPKKTDSFYWKRGSNPWTLFFFIVTCVLSPVYQSFVIKLFFFLKSKLSDRIRSTKLVLGRVGRNNCLHSN